MLGTPRGRIAALVTCATFTDIVAYSIAVPVLPDLGRRLGASPTLIGMLFASFGASLLVVSVPAGAWSDRVGRRGPMLGGLAALAAATLLFAFAGTLPWLFAARLTQGAADAVTWIVGFALIADLYAPAERGRVIGLVMSGSGFGFMIGPSIGGWLYEWGGMRLPFLVVAGASVAVLLAFLVIGIPDRRAERDRVPFATLIRVPAVAACVAAVVAVAATLAMLEPVVALQLQTRLDVNPARVGLLFGMAALATMVLHPIYGRLTDRFGGRRLTLLGLLATAAALPALGRLWSFESAVALFVLQACAGALAVTPSLAYMAEVVSAAGSASFGAAYGVYNFAWGIGILAGPAAGGYLFERLGFAGLTLAWAPAILTVFLFLMRVQSSSTHGAPAPSD
jgi:MFS transporter, DHA1 family, solute carrier family 18 (vesicular amine transporter), member 1/2